MSRESKLVKNTLILSIGTFLPKVAAFITLPLLTAYLSKEQYGTYDLICILVSLVLPVATLQIHTALFRFLIERYNDRDLAKVYYTNAMMFVIPVSLIALALLYCIIPIRDREMKIWMCLYLFFDTIVSEARQVARGLSKTLDYSISATISALIKMILAFVLVRSLKMELKGAVIALALSPVLSLIYLWKRINLSELIDFKLIDKRILKEMISYSWPMVPNNMSGWVMSVSDRFVVTAVLGLPANAVYAVANKIPSMLTLAQSTFNMAWQENASVVSEDKDAGDYYSKMFKIMINFYSGCLGLLIAFSPVLFFLLIKGDYGEALSQMPILFLATFFSCMSTFVGGIYIAKKETKSVGITTMFAAFCNVVVDIALIKKIGLYAASGSTLVSYLVLFIYRIYNVRRYVKIKYNIKQVIVPLAVIITESIVFYIGVPWIRVINAIFAVASFLLLNRYLLSSIVSKIKKRKNSRMLSEGAYTYTDYTPEENKAPEINTSPVSCCGCSACYSICPVGAITMIADEEGFLYPMVNKDKCILCRSCEKVCSFRSDRILKE